MNLTQERLRAIVCQSAEQPQLVSSFLEFRKALFVDRLGWDLPCSGDKEVDEFDTEHATYCIVQFQERIVAGFRALRTDHSYLALKVFPQLATLRPYPRRPDMWEISRFGVLPDISMTNLSELNYGLMLRFARMHRAKGLVAIADLIYERYLRNLGIKTRRYGKPEVVGQNRFGKNLRCVAGEIPLLEQNLDRVDHLISLTQATEYNDETLVLRRQIVSA